MIHFRMNGSRTPQPLPTSGPLLPAPGMLPQSGIRPLNPRGKTENSFNCLFFNDFYDFRYAKAFEEPPNVFIPASRILQGPKSIASATVKLIPKDIATAKQQQSSSKFATFWIRNFGSSSSTSVQNSQDGAVPQRCQGWKLCPRRI